MSGNEQNHSHINKWFTLDRSMIAAKITYLMIGGSIGIILPFTTIFLISVGCTKKETGVINGVTLGVAFIVVPFGGYIMDSIEKKRLFAICVLIIDTIPLVSMPFVAAYINPLNHKMQLEDARVKGYSEHNLNNEEYRNTLFWSMLMLLAITRCGKVCVLSILDAAVTDSINHIKTKESFGQQIMTKPLGMGLVSFIGSAAAETFRSETMSNYSAVLFCALPFNLLAIPSLYAVYNNTSWYSKEFSKNPMKDDVMKINGKATDHDEIDSVSNLSDDSTSLGEERNLHLELQKSDEAHALRCTTQENQTKDSQNDLPPKARVMCNTLCQAKMMLILSCSLVIACLRVTFNSYLFSIMADQMDASKLAMGVAEVINGISSCIFFFFAKTFINKFGVFICLEIAVAAWFILLNATSCIYTSWIIIILEILQGVGTPVAYAALTHYLSNNSPKEIYTTLFTIFQCLWSPAAGMAANIIGGFVYDSSSVKVLFRLASMIGIAWLLFMVITIHLGPFLVAFCSKSQRQHKGYRQLSLK